MTHFFILYHLLIRLLSFKHTLTDFGTLTHTLSALLPHFLKFWDIFSYFISFSHTFLYLISFWYYFLTFCTLAHSLLLYQLLFSFWHTFLYFSINQLGIIWADLSKSEGKTKIVLLLSWNWSKNVLVLSKIRHLRNKYKFYCRSNFSRLPPCHLQCDGGVGIWPQASHLWRTSSWWSVKHISMFCPQWEWLVQQPQYDRAKVSFYYRYLTS